MESRREFLKRTSVMALGLSTVANSSETSTRVMKFSMTKGPLRPEDVLDLEKMTPRGEFTEVTAPKTLDLAERARLSVNNQTQNVDPDYGYYVYQGFNFGPESPGLLPNARTLDITPKNNRNLPWLRTMCGSDVGLDREIGMMRTMLGNVRDDGLLYHPLDGTRCKGTAYPAVDGILALACENYYALDGNPRWLDWIHLLASGLKKAAIRIGDRAYYPPECSVTPKGNWVWNLRGNALLPYDPPQEPYLDQQGLEGSVKWEQGYCMRALVRATRYGGDSDALDLLSMFTRFVLKPGMWENTTLEGYHGNEHGIFGGHFHGNTSSLLSLLDVAEAQKSRWLMEFIREAYNNALTNGVVRLGWFPCWIRPTEYARDERLSDHAESDGLGEMIELAVRLSDVGLGDYWDDVDSIVRNQLTEQQFSDLDIMRQAAKGGKAERHVQDFLGGFTETPTITAAYPQINGCCSANGSMGLYYAWEGITRFSDGVATVNLFLNRVSSWMNVNSYLPYEGKVELHNKQARMALVRIPNWVGMNDVKTWINDHAVDPGRSGRYLIFQNLQKASTIRLEFPNPSTKERYTINGTRYDLSFRGSTVVDIEPRRRGPGLISLYQRSHFMAEKAPMGNVRRFVADKILPLQ